MSRRRRTRFEALSSRVRCIQEADSVRIVECEHRHCSHGKPERLDNPEEPRIRRGGEYGIHYVVEGEGFFRIDDARFPLRHDSLFVTCPGESYSFLLPN